MRTGWDCRAVGSSHARCCISCSETHGNICAPTTDAHDEMWWPALVVGVQRETIGRYERVRPPARASAARRCPSRRAVGRAHGKSSLLPARKSAGPWCETLTLRVTTPSETAVTRPTCTRVEPAHTHTVCVWSRVLKRAPVRSASVPSRFTKRPLTGDDDCAAAPRLPSRRPSRGRGPWPLWPTGSPSGPAVGVPSARRAAQSRRLASCARGRR